MSQPATYSHQSTRKAHTSRPLRDLMITGLVNEGCTFFFVARRCHCHCRSMCCSRPKTRPHAHKNTLVSPQRLQTYPAPRLKCFCLCKAAGGVRQSILRMLCSCVHGLQLLVQLGCLLLIEAAPRDRHTKAVPGASTRDQKISRRSLEKVGSKGCRNCCCFFKV